MWELYTGKRIKVWSHYMPIHLTTAYRKLGHGPGECPVAEELFAKYVSLPIHPRMSEETIQYVVRSVPGAGVNSFSTRVASMRGSGQFFSGALPIYVSRAPGRLDLMGGNVDYTGGLVFQRTIAEATWAAAQARNDRRIVFWNPQMALEGWQERVDYSLDGLQRRCGRACPGEPRCAGEMDGICSRRLPLAAVALC